MKKRLSLLMAALMILTMLPMSALAASKPYVTVVNVNDTEKLTKNTITLEVDQYQKLKAGKVIVTLKNAELAGYYKGNKRKDSNPKPGADDLMGYVLPVVKAAATNPVTATVLGEKTDTNPSGAKYLEDKDTFVLDVTASAGEPAAPDNKFKMIFELELDYSNSNDGDVMLEVNDVDQTGIGSQEFKIATVKAETKALTVTTKDKEKEISYDGGNVSRFDIKNFDITDAKYIAIELDADEYYAFDRDKTKVYVDGQKLELTKDVNIDGNGYVILLDNTKNYANKGVMGGKIISVDPHIAKMGRSATEGSVNVTVKAIKEGKTAIANVKDYVADKEYTVLQSDSANLGKVIDYKVTMTVTEKNKKEIPSVWGGEEATVTVTLTGPKGSFSNRAVEFETKDADIIKDSVRVRKVTPGKADDATVGGFRDDDKNSAVYKDGKFVITGISAETTKLEFDMRVRVDHSLNGTATITASQRGWETTADLVKSTPKFTLATQVTDMKKGEKKETANIVITEAKEGLLRNNEKITLLFNTTKDYVEFAKVAKVEATNGMTFGDWSVKRIGSDITSRNSSYEQVDPFAKFRNGGKVPSNAGAVVAVEIPIKKQSKGGAAVITISGIETRVDGSTVDSDVKVYAGLNLWTVASANYIKVVKEYGLEPILTVFTIGQAQYTVNGKPMTAASAPYVKNGRTMLPVRALAESLGLHVQWNGATKTATFTDSTKVAAVVIGADTMYINGTPVKLSAKAEIVNGTTFIELRSLATVFGVQIDWDAAAKTATVSK